MQQLVAKSQYESVFEIPWGHHIHILSKCKNDMLRKDGDGPTIGLLICKTKDNVLAQYAAKSSIEPIGISEFKVDQLVKDNFEQAMPTIEEIERCLKN